ncbi:immunoglobulin-like domain-containing protein [Acholeplasma laidlawii]|uniref:immunoglobulin-like domain-containing protein n=1 Tax=Acholeplasma laidlawii TaxID=2148 RepID=UPI0021F72CD1|nr:immunoglobulin-like domain-containing protein [Acholeplasma laidlawii]
MTKRIFLVLFLMIFTFVLASCDGVSQSDLEVLIETAEQIELELEVTSNFELPVTFDNDKIKVTWTSSDSAIFIVTGNQAIVTRGSTDVSVKLTASFTLNDAKHSVDFDVVVKAVESSGSVTVEITVTLPADTPMTDAVIIAGNFGSGSNMPEWDPTSTLGVANRIDATTASITIIYENLTDPLTIEYKWTRGSWATVEKDINGEEISDRVEVITSDYANITIENIVERWADMNPDLTDQQKLLAAKDALTLSTSITEDITLPLVGEHGSVIIWESNHEAVVIDGATGIVTRSETDVVVTLTASLSIGTLVETKAFEVTIISKDAELFTTFELTIVLQLPSNTPVDDDIFIFGNFPENTGLDAWGGAENPLNKFTRDGNTATLTIQFAELTENFTLEYKITRGDWTKVEGSQDGGYLENRTYVITRLLEIHEIEITVATWEDLDVPIDTDEQKLIAAKDGLTIPTTLTENITLPLTGIYESVISWSSNHESIEISGATGLVTRAETDVIVELTATIQLGDLTETKVFEVLVESLDTVYYETLELTITLNLPSNTPLDDDIFIFGNFPENTGLDAWGGAENPLNKFTREGNTATLTIQFTELTENFNFEYKITRGDWTKVEGNEVGAYRPNRTFTHDRTTSTYNLEITVLSWEDQNSLPTVMGNLTIIEDFLMPEYGENIGRTIRVWTPTGYDLNGTKTYPVIYMQDGQNVFDSKTSFAGEWEIDETISNLIAQGLFDGAIVVGIDNNGANRIHEYTPNWSDTPEAGGGLYLQFIVETLKPYIDANYLTKPEREYTMIAGSSMGGLISFYAGLEYPEVFGLVGAFSTSFQINTLEARQAFINSIDTNLQLPRMIIDAGSEESLNTYVSIVVEELNDTGYPMENIFYEVVSGHAHNEPSWKARFGDALLWLFSQNPGNYIPVQQ